MLHKWVPIDQASVGMINLRQESRSVFELITTTSEFVPVCFDKFVASALHYTYNGSVTAGSLLLVVRLNTQHKVNSFCRLSNDLEVNFR